MQGIIIFFAFLALLIPWVVMYEQSDYHIDFERLEILSFNKVYLSDVRVVTYKINRTHPALNASFTLAMPLGNDVEVIAQAYTFMSNEYRLFPLRLGFNLCEATARNDFGLGEVYKYGNYHGCPLTKSTYYLNKWAPDASRFPPFIPNGRYMIELQALHASVEIAILRGYATVSRPLGRRH